MKPHSAWSADMGVGFPARLQATEPRPGIEALRGAVDQPGLNVEVDQDGWVTIRPSGEPGLDVIDGFDDPDDEVELRRAA